MDDQLVQRDQSSSTATSDPNRSIVVVIVLAVITLLLIIVFIFTLLRSAPDQKEAVIPSPTPEATDQEETVLAVLGIIGGQPQVRFNGTEELISAEDGLPLEVGDQVITDDKTRAFILFRNNNTISLDVSSELTINGLAATSEDSTDITQIAGRLWHRAEKPLFEELYTVNMNSGVVRVIGTTFISTVLDEVKSSVRAVLNTVEVAFADMTSELDFTTMTQGNYIELSSERYDKYRELGLSTFIKPITRKDDWFKFNECLDSVIPKLIRGEVSIEGKFEKIRERIKINGDCKDILGVSVSREQEETVALSSQSTIWVRSGVPAGINSVLASFDDNWLLLCSWSVSGDDVTGYEYSIGTAPGKSDIKSWTYTSKAAVSAGSASALGLVNQQNYYCNLRVFSVWGNAEGSSSTLYYDLSQATITQLMNPEGYFDTGVSGLGEYNQVSLDSIQVRFKLQNVQENSPNFEKYCRNYDAWGDEKWFVADTVANGLNRFTFDKSSISCDDQGNSEMTLFTIQLRNLATSKILYEQKFEVVLQ